MHDIAAVRQAAEQAGFAVVSTVYKTHQFSLRRDSGPESSVAFDVHWRILNAPRFARVLSFDEAYQDSVKAPGLKSARMLNSTDALLIACMHRLGSERHDGNRLIWIHDIHALVSTMTPTQLNGFTKKAVARNVQATCLDGLRMAQDRFHTSIPAEVLSELERPEFQSDKSLSKLYSDSYLSLLINDMKNLPDMHSRLSLLGELFFPSPDALMRKYERNNRLWLPLLYLQQVVGGITKRLLLR